LSGSSGSTRRWRRALLLIAAAAYAWAAVVTITGGFVIRTGWLTASSRNPRAPLMLAVAASGWYAIRFRRHWLDDLALLATPAPARGLAILCTCCALVAGIGWGSFIGGGPDASGYVSQADMWVKGVLTLPAPEWARKAPWPNGVWSSAPVGYGPDHTGEAIVPMYSPGLPLMMATFQAIGGASALFYVVPLSGAALVWASYVLGLRLGGPWTGAAAAVLLTSSAPFLLMIVQPMSDVPAAACWTLALAYALGDRRRHAVMAGIATGAAVLVRPNVAPLAIVVALLLMANPERRWQRLIAYIVPAAAGAAMIGAWNWHLHGSPLVSGYGSLGQIYRVDRIPANLARYVMYLVDMQTPLIFVGLLAPLAAVGRSALRVALVATVFPAALLAMYLPWIVIDNWSYLRLLLPAYPAVLAGCGVALAAAARRTNRALVAAAGTAIVAVVATHSWQAARRADVFGIAEFDRRYARAVDLVEGLPRDAVIVSNLHSGTLRFYTGRDILRFEVMLPEHFDDAIAHLRKQGHPIYFVGDPDEVDYFVGRFAGSAAARMFQSGHTTSGGVVTYEFN
jgi:hypothetical protein